MGYLKKGISILIFPSIFYIFGCCWVLVGYASGSWFSEKTEL